MPDMDDVCATCGHIYMHHSTDDACPIVEDGRRIKFDSVKRYAPAQYNYGLRVHIAGDWREYKCASIADAEALQGILEGAGYPVTVK